MNVVYPVLIYYFIFSACVIKGSCDSCRNKTVDLVLQLKKLNSANLKNIRFMRIRTRGFNEGTTILVHKFAEENFENIRCIADKKRVGLDNLLLLRITDIDLEGKESIRYVVYSKNSYDTATNREGGEEKNVTFKEINFFVPSGENDGKYVMSSDEDAAELFSKLYNKNKNSTLIKIDTDIQCYIQTFFEGGMKELELSELINREKGKKMGKSLVPTWMLEDGEKITVSISEQLMDQRKK